MLSVELALRNYLVNPNDVDLGFAMARLAELAKNCCHELSCPPKKVASVLAKTFSIDLKIGKWPDVLEGKFDENFKVKTEAFLAKKNKDVHKVAELMVKQCTDTVKKNLGVGK